MNRHLHERRKTRPRLCRATILQATVILTLFILSARPACADAESKENSLKIISFNVWFGLDGNGIFRMGEHETGQEKEKRYRGLVAGLREYDPDILFIQEANPLPGYARRLAKDVGMDEIHAVNNGGIRAGPVGVPTNLRMGIAILAKPGLNLKKVGTYRTSGTGIVGDFFCFHLSEVRELLAGVVYPNTRPLYLFCMHAHASVPDSDEYRSRLKALLEAEGADPARYEYYESNLAAGFERVEKDIMGGIPYIEEVTRGGEPFVVAGDFNAYSPVFPSIGKLAARLQLTDSFAVLHPGDPGYTWDPFRNPLTIWDAAKTWADGEAKDLLGRLEAEFAGTVPQRIDYIFLSDDFASKNMVRSEVIFTEPNEDIFVSDHFGVMTEVLLR